LAVVDIACNYVLNLVESISYVYTPFCYSSVLVLGPCIISLLGHHFSLVIIASHSARNRSISFQHSAPSASNSIRLSSVRSTAVFFRPTTLRMTPVRPTSSPLLAT
jgi:hypothetical protein